eukprot:CAMPEP_0198507782 /NCGR_PEP_ID=MMETSP1462-20131121/12529_1 /TAXON_ID=1333877 /ORGANISM="Brandtodinium nutriculum, Strain RCC3387" /LENGTH=286 /DNA_ID=CAMNT_0044237035 /DNA_START=62 /DNA_END=922 /DNA_ORIENTATION=-
MTLIKHEDFPSAHVAPRHVQIWLPSGYAEDEEPYAVLYMHDGQNLFESEAAAFGESWEVPAAMARVLASGSAKKTLVVGVWNTAARFREYLPDSLSERLHGPVREQLLAQQQYGGAPMSSPYVRFLTEELKPFIDKTYRTSPDAPNTFVMGSSMGGLASWYALAQRPDVFGAAGCISTHWPLTILDEVLAKQGDTWKDAVAEAVRTTLSETLPACDSGHRFWFDYGTEHLDAHYEPYQAVADEVMQQKGYIQGRDVMTRRYEGASHNERSWATRLCDPLAFLLRKD